MEVLIFAPKSVCTNPKWMVPFNLVLAVVFEREPNFAFVGDFYHSPWFSPLWDRSSKTYQPSRFTKHLTVDIECASADLTMYPLIETLPQSGELRLIDALQLKASGNIEVPALMSSESPLIEVQKDLWAAYFLAIPVNDKNARSNNFSEVKAPWWRPRERLKTDLHTAFPKLLYQGLEVSNLPAWNFEVTDMSGGAKECLEAVVPHRIFASYAREDLSIVKSVASIIRALSLGEILWDLEILTSGDDWNKQIFRSIEKSNMFQLFWSENSKKSKNVKYEWAHALSLKRNDFIKPVYWHNPMPSPPRKLKNLHFSKMRF